MICCFNFVWKTVSRIVLRRNLFLHSSMPKYPELLSAFSLIMIKVHHVNSLTQAYYNVICIFSRKCSFEKKKVCVGVCVWCECVLGREQWREGEWQRKIRHFLLEMLNITVFIDVKINVPIRPIFESIWENYPEFSANSKIALSSAKECRLMEIPKARRDLGHQTLQLKN